MSILSLLGIGTAVAATESTGQAAQPHTGGGLMMLLPLLIIVVLFFFMYRQQSRRAKEQKKLLDSVAIGDEIVTTGGIVGRVSKMHDDFMVIKTGKDQEITMKKAAVSSVLPKGTIDSIR